MTQKIDAAHGDFDHADQTAGTPYARPADTEWQAFFRQVAENLDADEREALPAHIQE